MAGGGMTAPTLLKLLAFVPVLVAVIGFWVTRPKRRVVEPPEPPYPAPPGMCWIYDAKEKKHYCEPWG